MTMSRLFFALLLIALVSNCEKKILKQEEAEVDKNNQNNSVALTTNIDKGKMVYFANCVSCHNNNPKKPGSIGPAVYGVPIDVLTQKTLSGKYPENYRPKRTSKIMPLMPHLNMEISNLYAFINSS
jgi:Predicted membrane protein